MRRLTIADLRSVTGLIIALYITMHLSTQRAGVFTRSPRGDPLGKRKSQRSPQLELT
jgi:hypothetical protein